SLYTLFPDVEPACITAVITHNLAAADLYKLDARIREADPTYNLGATGMLELSVGKHRTYKTFSSTLSIPLHTYFAILGAHLAGHAGPGIYFHRYLEHLELLVLEFDWAAVLEYHMRFFNRRRRDMLQGAYQGWGDVETSLLSTLVYPHRK
ncbi:hypothetical protein GGX14DRAFT_335285, partial [Mycena pura]